MMQVAALEGVVASPGAARQVYPSFAAILLGFRTSCLEGGYSGEDRAEVEEESFVHVVLVVVAEEVGALRMAATGMAVAEGQGCICADCPYWTPLR
jgi:hypothetical protein